MQQPLRVMTVFGTRPDAIKMAPVVLALQNAAPEIESIVCVTGQHRALLDEILTTFAIEPTFDLAVMQPDQTLTQITHRVLVGMEQILSDARPDVVLVHGDTTTSIAAALAAFYARIPVGHVEAGLRSGDRWDPFPEEMNRRLTGAIASLHFAPTEQARRHLLAENVAPCDIVVTGNTVIDAFLAAAARSDDVVPPGWERLDPARPVILVTAHRRENHDAMDEIAEAMRDLTQLPQRPQIYWPVHPSPRVGPVVRRRVGATDGIVLVDPIGYRELVSAVRRSVLVLTDSGGLQEEAPCLGKPVLVMRRTTERPEGLAAGTLELVGAERATIVPATAALLGDAEHYERMAQANNPYGDGQASRRIVATLLKRLRRETALAFEAVA